MVTTTYIQSKTIITMLFLFLEHHHVPNKFGIFVGHNNVKDRLSVKRIGLQVPAIFTKTTKAKFSFTLCCEDVNLQVFFYGFCSTCLRSPHVPANAAGSGWLEKGAAGAVLWLLPGAGLGCVCAAASLRSLCSSPVLYKQLGAENFP